MAVVTAPSPDGGKMSLMMKIILAMGLTQVGLPIEGIAMILAVDRLMDMIRTAVNVTGDAIVTSFVAMGEG